MVTEDFYLPIHWWTAERHESGLNTNIRTVLPFVFQTLDSLYLATRNFPEKWTDNDPMRVQMGGSYNMIISIPLSVEEYILFRSALSFTSDIYFLLDSLIKKGNLMELDTPINHLYKEADKFRSIRNFYTHLNERISNLDVHGVSGKTVTNCGIEYTEESKNNFHLIVSGNAIHFSQFKKSFEVDIGRDAFNAIFHEARNIYDVLTNHRIHARTYKSKNEIYPIT